MSSRCISVETGDESQCGVSSKKAREVRLVVCLSACKYPLVREAAERLGYAVAENESEMWDLFWSDLSVSADRVQRLLPFQRLNHFPGMLEICRKGALSKHMARMAARLPAEYRFYPPSLVLPDQLDELLAALRRNKARSEAASAAPAQESGSGGGGSITTFILKPSAGTQGRGISLVQYPHQLKEAGDVSSCVAQAYVASPLLLDGFKFDLRVYALVACVDPLRIHLYDEGLARLATQPYAPPAPHNLANVTMHLTNYSVNKGSAGFVSADTAPAGGGHKRPMSAVLAQVAAQNGTTVAALRAAIADVVTKTVMAIQPLLAHTYHTALSPASSTTSSSTTSPGPHRCACPSLDHVGADAADPCAPCSCPPSLCFELLGFDIMFDRELQPWLLEVNHSPSFASDSRLDRAVKGEMLARTVLMLEQRQDAKRAFLEAEARAQSERLYSSPQSGSSSYASAASGVWRTLSALPRNRNLQAAAAILDEITASSAALLAAGGHVWGGGSARPPSGSLSDSGPQPNQGSYPHSHRSASPSVGGRGGGGCAYGDAAGDGGAGGTRRVLSCSSAVSAFAAGPAYGERPEGCGGGGGGWGDVSGRFQLVFPVAEAEERKRYCRILQQAADLFPQLRCQCAWCSRRRDIALLGMSGQQLGLPARPSSAAMNGSPLSGHLPSRTGTSANNASSRGSSGSRAPSARRSGSATRRRPSPPAVAAGEDDGSGGERTQEAEPHSGPGTRLPFSSSSPPSSALSGPATMAAASNSAGGGSGPTRQASLPGALRGKPPRPTSGLRGARHRSDGSAPSSTSASGPATTSMNPTAAFAPSMPSGMAPPPTAFTSTPGYCAAAAVSPFTHVASGGGGGGVNGGGAAPWRRSSASLGSSTAATHIPLCESSNGSGLGDHSGLASGQCNTHPISRTPDAGGHAHDQQPSRHDSQQHPHSQQHSHHHQSINQHMLSRPDGAWGYTEEDPGADASSHTHVRSNRMLSQMRPVIRNQSHLQKQQQQHSQEGSAVAGAGVAAVRRNSARSGGSAALAAQAYGAPGGGGNRQVHRSSPHHVRGMPYSTKTSSSSYHCGDGGGGDCRAGAGGGGGGGGGGRAAAGHGSRQRQRGDVGSDGDDDGGNGAGDGGALRRSHSCSELEVAFRRASAASALAAPGRSRPSSHRPSAAAASSLLDSMAQRGMPRASTSRPHGSGGSDNGGGTDILTAAAVGTGRQSSRGRQSSAAGGGGGSSAGGGVPRVAYLGAAKQTPVMSPADIEIMMSRIRTASTFSSRYVR